VAILSRRQIVVLAVLLLVSPVFGVVLANTLGYAEPLDHVAEVLNLSEWEEFNWTPLKDYTFPGLPDWAGYIVSGIIGVVVILLIGFILQTVAVRSR